MAKDFKNRSLKKHIGLPLEVKDSYFDNSLKFEILEKFPKINELVNQEDGIYLVMGTLYNYMIENSLNKPEVLKIIEFLNHAFDKGKDETKRLIMYEFIENVWLNNILKREFQKYLKKDALDWFEYMKAQKG